MIPQEVFPKLPLSNLLKGSLLLNTVLSQPGKCRVFWFIIQQGFSDATHSVEWQLTLINF